MNPGYPPPPPPGPFFPNMHMPLINLSGQFPQIPTMGGLMQIPVGMPPQIPGAMGITVPTGVTSISAPPVRNIIPTSAPSMIQSNKNMSIPAKNPVLTIKQQKPSGPPITVFVGNITERATDQLIRQLLAKCGQVSNWKRVHGANGKLQAFGFCDFVYEESAMRAIRILHDLEICDKKLLVKVDAKTHERLEKFVKDKNAGNNSETSAESKETDSKEEENQNQNGDQKNGQTTDPTDEFAQFVDDDTLKEDQKLIDEIQKLLSETKFEQKPGKNDQAKDQADQKLDGPKPDNFADMDIDNEKKNLIHREIGKFRDAYKKQDEEKEKRDKEREQRRELDRQRDDRDRRRDTDRAGYRERDKERDRERGRERDRERERRERRSRSPTTSRDRNGRRMDRERFEREAGREAGREIGREAGLRGEPARDARDEMDEESAFERRRIERELRKKEQSYQERLKNWENREMRKQKEREKERIKQEQKQKNELKDVMRLKQFLEDYNDDVDDAKFYKGSVMQRKLKEREKEKEEDELDRQEEKRELEELRQKLAQEGVDTGLTETAVAASVALTTGEGALNTGMVVMGNKSADKEVPVDLGNGLVRENAHLAKESKKEDDFHVKAFSLTKSSMVTSNHSNHVANGESLTSAETPLSDTLSVNVNSKKGKPSIQEVFNTAEDDEGEAFGKKRRLPLFDDNTDSNQSSQSSQLKCNSLTAEEKRKQIRSLIDNIPTSKEDLFKYSIDWSIVDQNLMEKRIRPWINKKITEYIGEEEVALLDFICTKLNAKCNAQSILKDVAMVLDEEAEVFVMKMWRLLIYEIEMKKSGLSK